MMCTQHRPRAGRNCAAARTPAIRLSQGLALCVAVGCVLLATGCPPPAPRYDYNVERKPAETFTIGAGDVLVVRVWRNDALGGRVIVRPDGYITVPLVGDVPAGGRTTTAIAEDIAERSKKFYTEAQVVAVEMAELHSYRVYVLGEIAKPGEFSPKAPISVLQALALAGGFTRFASPDRIVIVRKDARGQRRIPFVYSDVTGQGDLRGNLVLQPNDTVVVP